MLGDFLDRQGRWADWSALQQTALVSLEHQASVCWEQANAVLTELDT